jgi:hypothetical protein
MKCFIN